MSDALKNRIHEAVTNPQLQKNYYKATSSAVEKNEIRSKTPELFEQFRTQAQHIRKHTLDHLETYLEQAENKFISHGIKVHWAVDAKSANSQALKILQKRGIKSLVKAKSMLTEELEVNDFLIANGIEINETDLGEFIIQVAGEKPSHITAPAIHKSAGEIARLFEEHFNLPYTEDEHILTEFARNYLREKFLTAEVGISGANFILADSGTIVLVENEGNIRLSTILPKVHIVFVGIEKMLPNKESLGTMLELLSYSATGQKFPGYVSLISNAEPERELHVIFVDNGRTALYKDSEMQELLHCIRCGACLNSCPVYQHVGGHTYGWTYPGPIGALLTATMRREPGDEQLPFMSSLCGACTAACPVKIPLHHLLLKSRHRTQSKRIKSLSWNLGMKGFSFISTHPKWYRMLMLKARLLQKLIPGKFLWIPLWSKYKKFPKLAKKAFRK